MTTFAGTGRFISFEGIDGSGKSTQARRLAAHVTSHGADVVLTREPGGSPGAELIRSLLVEGDTDRWSAETELLLFTAARRDHLERTIRPALARGAMVITDRFCDSTRVYQGTTRGDLIEIVDQLHALMIGTKPDLTFVIDLDPEEALARTALRNGGEGRFETFGVEFQRKLRRGFHEIAEAEPARVKLIDGTGTQDAIADRVLAALDLFGP